MSSARLTAALACAAVGTAAIIGALFAAAPEANAQDIEAQALQIERQLLCPQCTNVRLDHCELAICTDMRRQIREQLVAGRTGDDILVYFSNRFGERVLADLPRSGFNLWLFGWVGGSIVIVALAGAATLWRLRRTARSAAPAASPTLSDTEERWLDDQLRHELDPEGRS